MADKDIPKSAGSEVDPGDSPQSDKTMTDAEEYPNRDDDRGVREVEDETPAGRPAAVEDAEAKKGEEKTPTKDVEGEEKPEEKPDASTVELTETTERLTQAEKVIGEFQRWGQGLLESGVVDRQGNLTSAATAILTKKETPPKTEEKKGTTVPTNEELCARLQELAPDLTDEAAMGMVKFTRESNEQMLALMREQMQRGMDDKLGTQRATDKLQSRKEKADVAWADFKADKDNVALLSDKTHGVKARRIFAEAERLALEDNMLSVNPERATRDAINHVNAHLTKEIIEMNKVSARRAADKEADEKILKKSLPASGGGSPGGKKTDMQKRQELILQGKSQTRIKSFLERTYKEE